MFVFLPIAAVNNSSDTESVPSPRHEAKESKDNEAKPTVEPVVEGDSEVAGNSGNSTSPQSQELAERTSNGEETKEEPESIAVKKEEECGGKIYEELVKSEIKQEELEDCKEGVAEKPEEPPKEATEALQKVEKKPSKHGGKTNADSDSSATCSADEAEEQDSSDKNRYNRKSWDCRDLQQ